MTCGDDDDVHVASFSTRSVRCLLICVARRVVYNSFRAVSSFDRSSGHRHEGQRSQSATRTFGRKFWPSVRRPLKQILTKSFVVFFALQDPSHAIRIRSGQCLMLLARAVPQQVQQAPPTPLPRGVSECALLI